MAKQFNKLSLFENASIVWLKSNNRQIKLLSRHDNIRSNTVSWYAEYYGTTDYDGDSLIVRESEIYGDDFDGNKINY
ncbi:hypothetical protein B0A58_15615 [Flavobacterium branchiophilum NBRC 15030 = ATCC 35035]|uniref:Uncharacterized protein n=1 Tax=Flavobacterium branchiophilum TaxID=55197 RepID=A0A543G2L6_9FLAO|nr:hypothetical protein [Flavobacterium branchiophilum]OXA68289.1 hypothetical protein B0A58_15615 [Flavobacterium branchiophilum NBRC 15030 = ATCC 35035]TQM40336.1 hypothetical protein BC670_1217 [Flavobacterium branchiophilum]GEM56552.1 hypothetical protein FB1_27730 [Flavobacterium branchiophilum NBRC 15030 = ATCC 35035]